MPASSAGRLCVFVSGEAKKSEYCERLVAVSSSWGRREWLPANTSLHYISRARMASPTFLTVRWWRRRCLRCMRGRWACCGLTLGRGCKSRGGGRDASAIDKQRSARDLERQHVPLGASRGTVRTEWLLREIHDRFVRDNLCDWLLLAEDDSYVELPAVRRVIEARLVPQAASGARASQ